MEQFETAKQNLKDLAQIGCGSSPEWASVFALRTIAFAIFYGLYAIASAIRYK